MTWVDSGSTPSGSAGSVGSIVRAGPAHGRGRIDRRIEIVAERRAERGLVALLDREIVDHRRPQVLGVDMQQPCQRLRLGLEALRAPLRLGERRACDVERLAGGRMRGFGAQRRRFRVGDRALRRLDRARRAPPDRRCAGASGVELGQLGLDRGDLAGRGAPAARSARARCVSSCVAPRRQIGERAGQLAERLFGGGAARRRPAATRSSTPARCGRRWLRSRA